ncbi:MAG: MerC domain-containing protein [Armatimonadetes bacterium]|nr:MerC domain-containing protein [Armatimonadota bacterium]
MAKSTMTAWERIGVCAGTLCAVHCVLTGLALGLLSVAGLGFLKSPLVEFAFIGTAALTGLWAIQHGVRRHHSWVPAIVFVSGLALIVGSHFVFESGFGTTAFGSGVGVAMAITGGLAVGAFHFVNRRMQHRGCSCGMERR